jgi:hypothetical protein
MTLVAAPGTRSSLTAAAAYSAVVVTLFFVGAVLLLFAAPERHRDVDVRYFHERLARIAGPGAIACSNLMVDHKLGSSLGDCLPAAVASDRPFHAALVWNGFGHGVKDWIGYARDAKGRVWVVTYDPDVRGGWGERPIPSMSQHLCPGFRLKSYTRSPLFCDFGLH